MNNPSPLIPQGVTPPRGKSSLYIQVLMIVMFHVVVIGGMLLAGCDRTKDTSKLDNSTTPPGDTTALTASLSNAAPTADVPSTLNPNISNTYAGTAVSGAPAVQPGPAISVAPPAKASDLTPPATTPEAKEYVIAKGDTLGAIARKNGVALKALMDANPGVNAKKLKIGQKVQIPGGAAEAAAASTTAAAPADAGSAESSLYVVKSGDMLLRIAKSHGTTVKKIMAMNDLKTTSIHVGQKLKVPAPKTSEPSAAPAPVPASAPATGPISAPASATSVTAQSPVAAN